jgi:gliding motility-associated-like protein
LLDGVTDPGETIIFTVTTTNACGLTFTESLTLYTSEATPITVDAGNDVTVDCQTLGNGITFNATAGGGVAPLSYTWSNGLTTNPITVTSGGNTTLYVTVTDACHTSTATDSVAIIVENAPPVEITASNDTLICQGSGVQLSATATGGTGTLTYLWSTGNTNSAMLVMPETPTNYTVTATDECGISAIEHVFVDVSIIDASFIYQLTGADGEVIFSNLSIGNIVSYEWDFGDGTTSTEINPTHTYNDAGEYTVMLTVVNDEGCINTISKPVKIVMTSLIFIPNAFTPNEDGNNDTWFPVGRNLNSKILYIEVHVFNRWGQRVFRSATSDRPWNGYDNNIGAKCPQGIYAYRVIFVDPTGREEKYSGAVNLIR